MDKKDMIIVLLVLIVGIGAVFTGAYIYFNETNNNDNNSTQTNITTNNTTNTTNVTNTETPIQEQSNTNNPPQKESTSKEGYGDWQEDYETGQYDEDGNPIYRSVSSNSKGGQSEPGIYEQYWSSNGPISNERIG
ncbi:MAG: hypothetical protein KO202_06630 [Methanobacteriaceae archaeon]|jgi:predicted lipoprotein with Yx(FWY)xxD motif|nr:hypothetical protein [Methanobacteriaceae archaeon]